MQSGNLLENLPKSLPEEALQVLVKNSQIKIERIISKGHSSPQGFWYDQQENEWVLLMKGKAKLQFEAQNGEISELTLKPGDYIEIPAHRKHRVEWTEQGTETIWLAIFYK